jgi:hypothetical protein
MDTRLSVKAVVFYRFVACFASAGFTRHYFCFVSYSIILWTGFISLTVNFRYLIEIEDSLFGNELDPMKLTLED